MVQIGLNMGPRQCRVLGLAVSFSQNLKYDSKLAQDRDAVGALSLVWGLIQHHVPMEVIDITRNHLQKMGLPNLATRTISPGKFTCFFNFSICSTFVSGLGYTIQTKKHVITFPVADQAPPEGYMTVGYRSYVIIII
jgi:hypothetical protein